MIQDFDLIMCYEFYTGYISLENSEMEDSLNTRSSLFWTYHKPHPHTPHSCRCHEIPKATKPTHFLADDFLYVLHIFPGCFI